MSDEMIIELIWRLTIAIAPIIVSALVAIVQNIISKMTDENKERLSYWVNKFVDAAQMLEPDPIKRKEWVMAQILKLFPRLDPVMLSALIESCLVGKKTWDSDTKKWEELPPTVSRLEG